MEHPHKTHKPRSMSELHPPFLKCGVVMLSFCPSSSSIQFGAFGALTRG